MKQCVNGNCSIKATCAIYHQAQNMHEARGSDGKYARYSCRKGCCAHFVARSSHTQLNSDTCPTETSAAQKCVRPTCDENSPTDHRPLTTLKLATRN